MAKIGVKFFDFLNKITVNISDIPETDIPKEKLFIGRHYIKKKSVLLKAFHLSVSFNKLNILPIFYSIQTCNTAISPVGSVRLVCSQ